MPESISPFTTSFTPADAPRPWKGAWLLGVAALHTLFALLVFPEVLYTLASQGLLNSVGHDPARGAVVWFVLFGAVLALLGASVWQLECATSRPELRPLGWGLCALIVLGVVLMPASGFWLAFPPAIAMLRGSPLKTQTDTGICLSPTDA